MGTDGRRRLGGHLLPHLARPESGSLLVATVSANVGLCRGMGVSGRPWGVEGWGKSSRDLLRGWAAKKGYAPALPAHTLVRLGRSGEGATVVWAMGPVAFGHVSYILLEFLSANVGGVCPYDTDGGPARVAVGDYHQLHIRPFVSKTIRWIVWLLRSRVQCRVQEMQVARKVSSPCGTMVRLCLWSVGNVVILLLTFVFCGPEEPVASPLRVDKLAYAR